MSSSFKDSAHTKRNSDRPDTSRKSYAYHAHDVREVLQITNANRDGLEPEEVLRRQEREGPNTLTQKKQRSVLEQTYDQFKSPIALVLVVAFVVTLTLQEFVDATVIGVAVLMAVAVGVLQEGRSSRAFEKLSQMQVHTATVRRGGYTQEIPVSALVVGDVLVLQGGARVPADARLLHAKQLSVNESALTGEWLAVAKESQAVPVGTPFAEQSSMVWMGTYVASGYATAVVTALGDNTALGKLAQDVQEVEEVQTPLQEEMVKVSRVMLYMVGVFVLLIFVIGLLKGHTLNEMLLMSIAIAVASVPEGLPAAITIVLAIGMESLLKRGGLVRNLLAAETLGSTTYVLTDKTGTLTQARMDVVGVLRGRGTFTHLVDHQENAHVRNMLDIALAATTAYTDKSAGKGVVRGDPVEEAILRKASAYEISEYENSLRARRSDYFAFSSERMFAAGLSKLDDTMLLCCNGAPATLLTQATQYLDADGHLTKLSEAHRKDILHAIAEQTSQGRRLVAVGYKPVGYDDIPEDDSTLLADLVFVGVFVFDDPIRKSVPDAIKGVQSAGAQVVLVTGDNPQTALSIARAVGIAGADDVAFTGVDLEDMSDDELYVALQEVHVFARIIPRQKMRIASILQGKGEVVAMTGDGINDAPALRRANIGVAIGSGTEVAKESSDLVLTKDSFATMYAAIEEGRRIIANLRKIVGYLLSTSLSEVVLIGTALLLSAAVPITPAQILWANIIEEGFMGVAFAFEKGEKDAMKRKPQDIHDEGILSPAMLYFIAMVVTIHGLLLASFYLYLRYLQLPFEELRSIIFLAVAADSLFISFAFRSLSRPFWRVPLRSNKFFVGSFILSFLLLFLVLTIPFFQTLLSYEPLPFSDIMLVLGFSLSTLCIVELAKWVFFENKDSVVE